MISVLIRTLNEEVNLPHCLESLRWCDDIVVLDSGSNDRTVQIAQDAGCRVLHQTFENESTQLNWAGTQIQYKHPWVYFSDADEVVPEDLKQELLKIADDRSFPHTAYRLRYKNYFMGRWIRHCGIYPVWVLRFYRPERVRWERIVKYSTHEAIESLRSLRYSSIPWQDLFQLKDPAARRRALKELSFRMPCRSGLRFLYMYIWRLGVLDGLPGYHYCKLLSIYEYLITLKIREMREESRDGGQDVRG